MSAIKEDLRQFIIENFLFGQLGKLEDNTSFQETGIIDSTGVLELLNFVQMNYGIEISDEELVPENLDSINNLAHFIERKQKESALSS